MHPLNSTPSLSPIILSNRICHPCCASGYGQAFGTSTSITYWSHSRYLVVDQPPTSPYARLLTRGDKRHVYYVEYLAKSPPPPNVGAIGDIWMDYNSNAYNLYYRAESAWNLVHRLDATSRVCHPSFDRLFLWCTEDSVVWCSLAEIATDEIKRNRGAFLYSARDGLSVVLNNAIWASAQSKYSITSDCGVHSLMHHMRMAAEHGSNPYKPRVRDRAQAGISAASPSGSGSLQPTQRKASGNRSNVRHVVDELISQKFVLPSTPLVEPDVQRASPVTKPNSAPPVSHEAIPTSPPPLAEDSGRSFQAILQHTASATGLSEPSRASTSQPLAQSATPDRLQITIIDLPERPASLPGFIPALAQEDTLRDGSTSDPRSIASPQTPKPPSAVEGAKQPLVAMNGPIGRIRAEYEVEKLQLLQVNSRQATEIRLLQEELDEFSARQQFPSKLRDRLRDVLTTLGARSVSETLMEETMSTLSRVIRKHASESFGEPQSSLH